MKDPIKVGLLLSRKHEVEVLADKKQISVFGGKLTDCINVGEEIAAFVKDLGVEYTFPNKRWYGEPDNSYSRGIFAPSKINEFGFLYGSSFI
jgi:glycerol-3-phosphate dehydrogenase